MKNLSFIICFVFLGHLIYAQQSGKISYKETMKLEFDMDLPDGVDLSSMLQESQSFNKELIYNTSEAVYRDAKTNENTDMEMESDDGSMKIVIKREDTEDIIYVNLKTKTQIEQRGFMGKSFVIEEPIKKSKWKLTGEKIKFLEYECQKAVLETDDDQYIAWFTPQIPVQHGPAGFNQLPGAVLMLTSADQKLEIIATNISFDESHQKDLKVPNDGDKVTQEEFDKIVEEKTKEMKEMFGGEGIIIRN